MQLRLRPALMDLLRFAHQPDPVDLSGGRQGADRYRHRIFLSLRVNDVLKEKRFALLFLQARETANEPAASAPCLCRSCA